MAPPSFCMVTGLLLSFVILNSAYDYGQDQKPKENENLGSSKPEYNRTPEFDQPKSEDLKTVDNKKPNHDQRNPEEKENHIPETRNYENIVKEEAKEKLIIEETSDMKVEYVKPEYERPKDGRDKQKLLSTIPNYEEKKYEVPTTIGVQGLVYCKSGLRYSPLPGAVARITCVVIDKKTYKNTQFTILSEPCNSKGYFNAKVYSELTIKNCKAYLDSSPADSCNVPTNINNGISGDLLASSSDIPSHHNSMKLSTVGPFFYTSYDHPVLYNKPVLNRNAY